MRGGLLPRPLPDGSSVLLGPLTGVTVVIVLIGLLVWIVMLYPLIDEMAWLARWHLVVSNSVRTARLSDEMQCVGNLASMQNHCMTNALMHQLMHPCANRCIVVLLSKFGGHVAKLVTNPGVIRLAPKFALFGSNNGLARALIEQYPNTFGGQDARVLGNEVGRLDRGQRSFWLGHPEATQCLMELLEVTEADLGLHAHIGDHDLVVLEFPELAPIDLRNDAPWDLGDAYLDAPPASDRLGRDTLDDWLDPAPGSRRHVYHTDWLHVADALERDRISLKLAMSSEVQVIRVDTLSDALHRMADPVPLIFIVATDGGANDVAALARRDDRLGTLVIAPFMLSAREGHAVFDSLSWERMTASAHERSTMDLNGGSYRSLRRWSWTLFPDWRERLLNRVERHLLRHDADTLLSAQEISDWLHRFDRRAVWFATTSDMFRLCRLAHHSKKYLRGADDPNASSHWMGAFSSPEPPPRTAMLRRLAAIRWQRTDRPWSGSLSLEAWSTLSPAPGAITAERLAGIAAPKKLEERNQAASRLAAQLLAGDPVALLNGGVLRSTGRNEFDFQHPTLAGLMVRDTLLRQITAEPLASWALACFDPGRRPLIDAVLDVLPMLKLLAVAQRLAEEPPNTACAIGASEALFMAVGRRIAQGDHIPAALIAAAHMVIARLDCSDPESTMPAPWSRKASAQQDRLAWISACWSWSCLPEAAVATCANWLFPGWCDVLASPPHWLDELWPDRLTEHLPSEWHHLLSVADLWLKDRDHPPEAAPRILQLALLKGTARGAWAAEPSWWSDWFAYEHWSWTEELFIGMFASSGPAVAASLLPSLLAFEQTLPYQEVYRIHLSPIRRWLLERIEAETALEGFDLPRRRYLVSCAYTLPPAWRIPLFRLLAELPVTERPIDSVEHLLAFGPCIAPILPDYLGDILLGWAAATCLWEWAPDVASHLLSPTTVLERDARWALLHSVPPSHLSAGIDALLASPKLLDDAEREAWVRRHLADSAENATRLLAIRDSPRLVKKKGVPPP